MDISNRITSKLDFSSSVYQQVSQKLGVIDSFNGKWKVFESLQSKYLSVLEKTAIKESVGSSTRIEGAKLSDDEVEKLMILGDSRTPINYDEQEVLGYFEALEMILGNSSGITIEEDYIHQLHSILLRHSVNDLRHKGKYKKLANQVVANYPDGPGKSIFITTEPHLTPGEMEGLLFWTNERLKKKDLHPMFITASFIYEFLSIHPYHDGNGRLSRLLTILLLLKQDYTFIRYVSLENELEARKEEYQQALMAGQPSRNKENERIESWVLFLFDCLMVITRKLDIMYDTYNKLKVSLNERQQAVMEFLDEHKTAQVGMLEKQLKVYSRNTLKKDLSYLVIEGLLMKTGKGRGARYHSKEPQLVTESIT
jgi:Fic family protein